MAINASVTLSKKTSKDFQSSNVSVSLTAEVDASLARPAELQEEVGKLFRQAEIALDAELRRGGNSAPTAQQHSAPVQRPANGNGNFVGMTASQRRAIEAIASRAGLDAEAEARELGIDPEHTSIREASKLIDHLKSLAQGGRIGGRQ